MTTFIIATFETINISYARRVSCAARVARAPFSQRRVRTCRFLLMSSSCFAYSFSCRLVLLLPTTHMLLAVTHPVISIRSETTENQLQRALSAIIVVHGCVNIATSPLVSPDRRTCRLLSYTSNEPKFRTLASSESYLRLAACLPPSLSPAARTSVIKIQIRGK